MLNYKNDPLILDKETVNDIIRNKKDNLIFLDKEKQILNLYSAFVKSGDFTKRDKKIQPLQRTIYVKVSEKLFDIINKRISNKKELMKALSYYTDRRTQPITGVNNWFKNKIFPIILLRILSKDKKEFSKFIGNIEFFTDFQNKSKFFCPKTLDELLDKKIVYLVGCSVGDGHIDKNGKRWTLVDGTSHSEKLTFSKKFIHNLAFLLIKYINNFEIKEHKTKCVLRINNKIYCRFLNFFFGLPFGKKKDTELQKPLILNLKVNDLEKYFWRGMFDTDGNVNILGAVSLCSSDHNLLDECKKYLAISQIQSEIKGYNLMISKEYLKKFDKIGFSHPRKQKEFLLSLKRDLKLISVEIKNDKIIDNKLLQIHNLIRIEDGSRIRIHLRNLRKSNLNREELKKIIKSLFNCELRETKDNRLYFRSKKVYEYLRNIFDYKRSWESINKDEELKLLNNWNEVWN